jgi:Hsp70 protein
MLNPQATRGHSLGLSVGATNLAGTRDGQTAVIRPSELTVQGLRLTGFVDRVGDPVPLVAPDGSTHQSERLLAAALGEMAQSVTEGMPVSDVAVTVPAHWSPSVVGILRRNLRDGLPVVTDATAALTALRANPGLPTRGVIVLCDFGGSGTSITLADAESDFAPIGDTVRYSDFSGDHIDQTLLKHVVAGLFDASQTDPSGTAMVGSLVRLRDECRRAKERLSAETATAVVAELPGHRADIRVARTELEDLIQAPLTNFLAALDDTLERSRVPLAAVSAVATVGGGARIPLITQRLSEHLRAPVVTTPHPQLTAAEGAALIAHRSRVVEMATTMTPAPGTAVATAAMSAGEPSSTFRALAWSEDAGTDDGFIEQQPADSRPELHFRHEESQDERPTRRAPIILFGLSAAAAVIASVVFGLTAFGSDTTTPVEAAVTVTPSPAPAAPALSPPPPAPQAPEVTTVVVQRSNPAPRRQQPQQPAPQQSPVAPTTTTTQPPTETPTTTPPTTTTPTTTTPTIPPIDPGTGGGTGTPPIDPGTGGGTGGETPPIDPGNGAGETGTGTPPIDPGTGAGA